LVREEGRGKREEKINTDEAMTKETVDFGEYVDRMAELIDLPIDPEYRPGVVDNITRVAAIAQLVNEFPLPDDIEAAPVFEP
jgi:hypothetical protein